VQVAIESGNTALTLEVEEYGTAERGTIILIMGLGTQLIAWPMDFVHALAAAGYRVIRFDNRDVGLSSKFESSGSPDAAAVVLRRLLHLPINAPYTLHDMAQDTIGLMDALKIERAHIVGASMGGMIAQILAARHPNRVSSLTIIMSSAGAPLPWDSTAAARKALLARPPTNATEDVLIDMRMHTYRVICGPKLVMPEEMLREMARRTVQRCADRTGSRRQLAATQATGSLKACLKDIHAPTLIIHGSDDPLIAPRRARQLHRHIRDSKLLLLEGMGHNLPQKYMPQIVRAIIENCAEAGQGGMHASGIH
jgi:pimeloyl-ACP methyl ester carboxylesterase